MSLLLSFFLLAFNMPEEYKIKTIEIAENGESILDLLGKKPETKLNVSNGITHFRENGKTGLKMTHIGDTSKITVPLYPDIVTESSHHVAIIQNCMFLFGIDSTTGEAAVYKSLTGTSAFTKIKDFAGYDEAASIWARDNVLFVTMTGGGNFKYSYSTDLGVTWSAVAAWTLSYINNSWNFEDALYLDNGSKIVKTIDGLTYTDFWNYSTVQPSDLVYFRGSIYVLAVRTRWKLLSFGRLSNGRYTEIEQWDITYNDDGRIAMGKTKDYIIISFAQKSRLQIYAFDLDNLYRIGDIDDTTYRGVRSAGNNKNGDFMLLAADRVSGSNWSERHQYQITNSLGIFKNRLWDSTYVIEEMVIFLDYEFWIGYNETYGNAGIHVFREIVDVEASSLVTSVTISTGYIDIGQHIPIGIRVHHGGEMNGLVEEAKNIKVRTFLDAWDGAIGGSLLGEADCGAENYAKGLTKTVDADPYDAYGYAYAQQATNFRFDKHKANEGDRVYFEIDMIADQVDFAVSPILYKIDYIYKPTDFGTL